MMMDHITTRSMERFCRGMLSMAEVIAYSEHLDGCDKCRVLYDSLPKESPSVKLLTLEAARDAWHIGDHPELEELADFAAGDLDEEDSEIIQLHLANCLRCRREVDDYAAFLRSIEPEMAISFHPQSAFERRWKSLSREFSKLPTFMPVTIAALILMALAVLVYRAYFTDKATTQITGNQSGNLVTAPPTPLPSIATPTGPATNRSIVDPSARATAAISGANHSDITKDTEHLPTSVRTLVASALSPKGLEKPAIVDALKTRAVTYRNATSDVTKLEIIGPSGTVLITDRPVLLWKSATGIRSYRVVVTDSSFNVIAESPWMSEKQWKIPSALARDKVYLWQVKGKLGDEETDRDPVAEARFKILSAIGETKIRALRQSIKSPFILALVMTEEGLLDDAERELQKVDQNSAPARKLLERLREWRTEGHR
jgi:hypothetical protein